MSYFHLLPSLADGRSHRCADLGIAADQHADLLAWLRSLHLAPEVPAPTQICLPDGLDLLNTEAIEAALPEDIRDALADIAVYPEIDSTNTLLLNTALTDGKGQVALAERQTAGRGRRGRQWVSPFGTNLYLSLLWRQPLVPHGIEGLSLAVGLAVIAGLETQGVAGLTMKWPNDLLFEGGKVGGILIEMKPPQPTSIDLVIGIGLNLSMPSASAADIDQPWRDLASVLPPHSRNPVAAAVIAALVQTLRRFSEVGFTGFREHWLALDAFRGRQVDILLGERVVTGVAAGVTDSGAFCLQVDGEVQSFHGGEVSLRLSGDS